MASEKVFRIIIVLFLVFIMVVSIVGYGFLPSREEKVESGDRVSIEYVWDLEYGRVVDTNIRRI